MSQRQPLPKAVQELMEEGQLRFEFAIASSLAKAMYSTIASELKQRGRRTLQAWEVVEILGMAIADLGNMMLLSKVSGADDGKPNEPD